MEFIVNDTKMITLPPPDYAPTEAEIALLAGFGVRGANKDGTVVAGGPVGFGMWLSVVHEGGAECLAWLLAHISDKQAAMLSATCAGIQKAIYLERDIYLTLSKLA